MSTPCAHDLIWINDADALALPAVEWLTECWHCGLPLVVRRDNDNSGRIPVGVRGDRKSRRAAGWIKADAIVRILKPEAIVALALDAPASLASFAPLQGAKRLAQTHWPWTWGITGSVGYGLATGLCVLHDSSDLDLVIRASAPLVRGELSVWQDALQGLPCRVDTQIETPLGAFALNEWLRGGQDVLVKTNFGPRLMADPWQQGAR